MSRLDKLSNQVAILAGGQGTRLASRSGALPKPMVPILGKPVLQHQIELCRLHGFRDILLLVHHRHEAISEYFGDGSYFGVKLSYAIEETPRGTSGALRDSLHLLAERFLVLYGDTYMDVDLRRIWLRHTALGAAATLFLHPNDHPQDSDLVEIDHEGHVQAILPYPRNTGRDHKNLVNAALYVLERNGLEAFTPEEGKADIAKHMFPMMLAAGRYLHGYVSPEYIKDMGTPDRLDKVARDIEVGLPDRLSTRQLRSAVFLDRDGTVNREVNHLHRPEQLELLEGAGAAIRRLNRAGNLAVLVTNQPVVARGDVTADGLHTIHARLESLLGADGAFLDACYVCPHHPDRGFANEVSALKIDCDCRKPKPGLIDAACHDMQISRASSWMVGDTSTDIEAGRRAGVRTVLVQTGYGGSDDKQPLRPDYVCSDLSSAVDWILSGHAAVAKQMLPVVLRCSDDVRLVLIGGLARSGKSTSAQVLKELLAGMGRTAHVISLDAWLKPAKERREGDGVLSRYDLNAATDALLSVTSSETRVKLEEAVYDRMTRAHLRHTRDHSIGINDILIVEGVPALLMPEICIPARSLRLYVERDESTRIEHIRKDNQMRGLAMEDIEALISSRGVDESVVIGRSKSTADFSIEWGG